MYHHCGLFLYDLKVAIFTKLRAKDRFLGNCARGRLSPLVVRRAVVQ